MDTEELRTLNAIDNALVKAAKLAGHGRESDGLQPLPLHMRLKLLCITDLYKTYRGVMNYGDFMRNLNVPPIGDSDGD